MRWSDTPCTNETMSVRPYWAMICGVRLSAARLADDDDLDRALGAQLGDGLEEIRETLHRDVARCRAQDAAGHALHVRDRLEHVGIDADRHHVHAIERHTEVVVDVDLRRLAHRHHVIHLPGHDLLHPHERVPASRADLLQQ